MLPENKEEEDPLGDGEALLEGDEVVWQPTEHAVLVVVKVLVVSDLNKAG